MRWTWPSSGEFVPSDASEPSISPLATASATSSPPMCTGVAPNARIMASVTPDGFTCTRAPAKASGDASGSFAPRA